MAAFWKAVFNDPIGRAEIWRLLDDAGAFKRPFQIGPGGFPQPDATWFKAGQKQIGLEWFLQWLGMEPANVLLMMTENQPGLPKPPK